MTRSQTHVAGAIGVAAAACFAAAFFLDPTPPTAGAAPAAVLQHAAAFAGQDRAAAFLFALSGGLLIAFIAGLRAVLRTVSGGPDWAGAAMLGGAIALSTLITASSVYFFTVASRAHVETGAEASVLSDLANYGFIFTGFALMLVVLAAAALLLRSGGALRVLGELALVVAVALALYCVTAFFSSGALVAGGAVSITGFTVAAVWFLFLSLALLVLEPHALHGGVDVPQSKRGGIRTSQ
jgi:hypothetical protein